MLVLSRKDIARCLSMREAVAVVKQAFALLSAGKAVVPPRVHIDVPDQDGVVLVMPGYLPEQQALAVKTVSIYPRNVGDGFPAIHALVLAVDPRSGAPLAVLEGAGLTALRTGAAAGAATDLLARAATVRAAIFGAGVQGRTQLEAVCAVRPIREAWVYDVDAEAAQTFAREMEEKIEAAIRVASSASEAASGADVICTATTSAEPVFEDRDIRPGTHINAMGVFKPDKREVPAGTVKRARVVVDSREACMEEASDLLIPLREGIIDESHITAELGEIAPAALGRAAPGRGSEEEITLFKSVGVAVQDAAVAAAVLARAGELGLGAQVPLD